MPGPMCSAVTSTSLSLCYIGLKSRQPIAKCSAGPGAASMKSVNKVILVGHLGKDPEVKYTPQGTPVAKFTLATNEWHNISAWQRTAEIAGEYLKKGSQVYIEGRLRTDSWDDKETGQKKYRTEIIVNDMVLLGARGQAAGDEFSGGSGGSRARGASAGGFDQRGPEESVAQGTQITDEDIPF